MSKLFASISNSRKMQETFSAIRHRNYKLWFGSQIISLLGSWMQITAQGYFIFELTHSPAFLGYVGFASGVPTWLLMIYAGVYADRYSRRNIIIFTQTLMMLLAFILAFLTFTHIVEPWHIILLAFFSGHSKCHRSPGTSGICK